MNFECITFVSEIGMKDDMAMRILRRMAKQQLKNPIMVTLGATVYGAERVIEWRATFSCDKQEESE